MNKHQEYIRKYKKDKYKILMFQVLFVVVFIASWEIFSTIGLVDEFLVSKPSAVISLLYQYIISK